MSKRASIVNSSKIDGSETQSQESPNKKQRKASQIDYTSKRKSLGWTLSGDSFAPRRPHSFSQAETLHCGPRWEFILKDINKFILPKLGGPLVRRNFLQNEIEPIHLYLLFLDGRISLVDHILQNTKQGATQDESSSLTRTHFYAFLGARMAMQKQNHFTKTDGWSTDNDPFVGIGALSRIITKTDYYRIQKLFQFDVRFTIEAWNQLSERYWLPHPHLAIDDKSDDFKGKSAFKTYRQRKPQPWLLLGYAMVDEHCFRVAYYPRFPPWAKQTKKYSEWKALWAMHNQDNSLPRPLPWKQFSKGPKTEFCLPDIIDLLLGHLPTNDGSFPFSFYDVTLDREFGTKEILNRLYQSPGLGFTVCYKSEGISPLFTHHLHAGLKYGNWNTCSNGKQLAISYYSSEIVNFITNIHKNQFVEENSRKIPTTVAAFRKRMRFVDTHDQRCNSLKFPFKTATAEERYWNGWERSIQLNCEIIYNFQRREKVTSKRFLDLLIVKLSEPYRSKKNWKLPFNNHLPSVHYPTKHRAQHVRDNTARCEFCKTSITKFKCIECNVFLHRYPAVPFFHSNQRNIKNDGTSCWESYLGIRKKK